MLRSVLTSAPRNAFSRTHNDASPYLREPPSAPGSGEAVEESLLAGESNALLRRRPAAESGHLRR